MKPSRLLFVCSGNTCRSPMAALIARVMAARQGFEFEIRSAGLMAPDSCPASEAALVVAAAHGLDLSSHRSARLTPADLEWADLVLGMAHGHVDAIRLDVPSLPTVPITAFLSNDHPRAGMGIDDPFGGSVADYEGVWSVLEEAVEAMFQRLGGLESDG
jgi:protein arginine phosphatase